MTGEYLQILETARTTVIWEIVLLSLFFVLVAVLVFLIPYEYKTKGGVTRSTFLRMTAKWQLWVFKGCFAALLIGVCLWFNVEKANLISSIDSDIAQESICSAQGEYAVEKPVFAFGSRRTVWITTDGTERSLIQYGSDLPSGTVGIGTVVYAEHSGIVLSLGEGWVLFSSQPEVAAVKPRMYGVQPDFVVL